MRTYKNGIKWYLSNFTPKKKFTLRGEVDPSYLYHPKAAKRIKDNINANPFSFFLNINYNKL